MTARRVTSIVCNDAGVVTHLCNENEAWSPRRADEVVLDLELGDHSYYVEWRDRRTQICDAHEAGHHGRHLRTDLDSTTRNNLLDLPVVSVV